MFKSKSRKSGTRDRILLSAQLLFSKYGFQNTTLRQVTSISSSNLASVSYHFGSKDGLIAHIIESILDEFLKIFGEKYQSISLNGRCNVESVIEIIVHSLQEINKHNPYACMLLYRFYESCNNIKYIKIIGLLASYEERLNTIKAEIMNSLSFLSEDDVHIRLSFLLNSLIPLLLIIDKNHEELNFISSSDHNHDVLKFVPVIAAGVLYVNSLEE